MSKEDTHPVYGHVEFERRRKGEIGGSGEVLLGHNSTVIVIDS